MITETVIRNIAAFILGNKYYANIVYMNGTSQSLISSFIFRYKDEAERHRIELESNRTYRYIETVSFRSRKEYQSGYGR